jgi:hypothetical protein
MSEPVDLAARKQLLLARSTLYRLQLQVDAAQLRDSMSAPARGLALVKYLPLALVVIRLVARGRARSVVPTLVDLASVLASWLLARRAGRDEAAPGD